MGLFFLLFFIESLIAGAAVLGYFVHTGRKTVADIEKYTRNYSIPLAEAFANVAELSFGTSFAGLNTLFQEKIQQNIVDEAFFVMGNGKLVVHSSSVKAKELDGNIANDEFSYNLDIIMAPLNSRSRAVHFTDYHLINAKIPFGRDFRSLMKEYLYPSIDKTGWIATRAVFFRNIPVGTVNFIISKERIYSSLTALVSDSLRIFFISIAGCFALSLIISFIVMQRYRRIQGEALAITGAMQGRRSEQKPAEAIGMGTLVLDKARSGKKFRIFRDSQTDREGRIIKTEIEREPRRVPETAAARPDDEYITVELLAEMDEEMRNIPHRNIHLIPEEDPAVDKNPPVFVPVYLGEDSELRERTVKDPIPVRRKELH